MATLYDLAQRYLNQGLPSISGIFTDTPAPDISPFLEDTEAEPTNAVGLTPEQLALLYPQYNLGGGGGGDGGENDDVTTNPNNAGITSLSGLFDAFKSNISPLSILGTLAFGPLGGIAGGIANNYFDRNDGDNNYNGPAAFGPGVGEIDANAGFGSFVDTGAVTADGPGYNNSSTTGYGSTASYGGFGGGGGGGSTGASDSTGQSTGSSGGYNDGNYCFDPSTPIQMADGSTKEIKNIQLGDDTKGGEVTGVFQFKASDEIHDYKGVTVAGSHYVKEDGRFIMVKDSPLAVKIDKIPVVYSLDTSGRRIFIKDIEFADYNGDGVAKNFLNNAGVDLTGFDKEVLRQVENRLI